MKKYLVGGAVRDDLLHLKVTERDWVVTGATPQEMLAKGYQKVGKDFPVFLHPQSREEYALARIERKSGYGYNGFICSTSKEVTLEDDLQRRDLTINAIARDEQNNIIDPCNGQKDINQRCLRHISNAFSEDPLRVLRVARFAARLAHLNFYIAPETMSLMQQMINELPFLTPERVWKETERALATRNPQVYFQVLRDCNALKILFPEIDLLFSISEPVEFYSEMSIGIHTMLSLYIVSCLSEDISVRFATLFHDITNIKLIESFCKRLKVPNQLRNLAKIAAQQHKKIHNAQNLTPKELIKLFNYIDVWRRPKRLEQLILISEADFRGYNEFKNLTYQQGNFLREAYNITISVSAKEILNKGLVYTQISENINQYRQYLLTNWKKNKNNNY